MLNEATPETGLRGFITERHLDQAEVEFPGITVFYATCRPAPRTFLDLVARYVAEVESIH